MITIEQVNDLKEETEKYISKLGIEDMLIWYSTSGWVSACICYKVDVPQDDLVNMYSILETIRKDYEQAIRYTE